MPNGTKGSVRTPVLVRSWHRVEKKGFRGDSVRNPLYSSAIDIESEKNVSSMEHSNRHSH